MLPWPAKGRGRRRGDDEFDPITAITPYLVHAFIYDHARPNAVNFSHSIDHASSSTRLQRLGISAETSDLDGIFRHPELFLAPTLRF
jgi:hypothetical protein